MKGSSKWGRELPRAAEGAERSLTAAADGVDGEKEARSTLVCRADGGARGDCAVSEVEVVEREQQVGS